MRALPGVLGHADAGATHRGLGDRGRVRTTTTTEQALLRSTQVVCAPVADGAGLAGHYGIRRQVFVTEQGLFNGSDRDDRDLSPETVHVLASIGGEPVGTVRLFPLDGGQGLWQGDRLAVLPRFRVHGAGRPLVRFAVAYASRCGGRRMVAHVQLPNVVFFQRLGWDLAGPVEDYLGAVHQPMSIGLTVTSDD
jgi:putative N-acetyltransferase (TIGR04045 family)